MRRRLRAVLGLSASLVALAAVSGAGVRICSRRRQYESGMGVARLPRHTLLVAESRNAVTRVPSERRLPVLVTTVVVVALLCVYRVHWPLASGGTVVIGSGLVFWTTLTLVVSAFPVVTPRGSVVSVSIAPILAAAILGGPTAAAIVGFVGVLELREIRRRIPWYGTLYNHCSMVISAVLAGVTFLAVSGTKLRRGLLRPHSLRWRRVPCSSWLPNESRPRPLRCVRVVACRRSQQWTSDRTG